METLKGVPATAALGADPAGLVAEKSYEDHHARPAIVAGLDPHGTIASLR